MIRHLWHCNILGRIQWMELKPVLEGGAGGESWERTPSVPMMTNVIMETSCGVPFIYLVEQIFPFTLSRSICIAQMSGKYHACERKKKKGPEFTSTATDCNSITLSLNRHPFNLYKFFCFCFRGLSHSSFRNRNLSPTHYWNSEIQVKGGKRWGD